MPPTRWRSAPREGILLTQSYAEGTMVKAGQVLFTLDKREYEAQLMQAKAQLAKAQADLAQAQEKSVVESAQANMQIALAQLNKTGSGRQASQAAGRSKAVPQQDYDNALAAQQAARPTSKPEKAALNTAKVNQTAAIQQAQAAVQAANASYSPGRTERRVLHRHVAHHRHRRHAPGGAGQPCRAGRGHAADHRLQRQSDARVREHQRARVPDVPAHESRGQDEGRRGELELILADGSVFPEKGRIIIADRAVDLKTGTLSLVAEFPNPKALLRPGQFGRVRLAATVAENALLVPQKAVTQMQSANVVYVVGDDNKVALRTVTLGDRVGQDYIVTEGVKAGERDHR